jgi:hypothetical protein
MGNNLEVGEYVSEEQYKQILWEYNNNKLWEYNLMRPINIKKKLLEIDGYFNFVNGMWFYKKISYRASLRNSNDFRYKLIFAKLLYNWYSNSIIN